LTRWHGPAFASLAAMEIVVAVKPEDLLLHLARNAAQWDIVTEWHCRHRGDVPGIEAVGADGVLHRIELDEQSLAVA